MLISNIYFDFLLGMGGQAYDSYPCPEEAWKITENILVRFCEFLSFVKILVNLLVRVNRYFTLYYTIIYIHTYSPPSPTHNIY